MRSHKLQGEEATFICEHVGAVSPFVLHGVSRPWFSCHAASARYIAQPNCISIVANISPADAVQFASGPVLLTLDLRIIPQAKPLSKCIQLEYTFKLW